MRTTKLMEEIKKRINHMERFARKEYPMFKRWATTLQLWDDGSNFTLEIFHTEEIKSKFYRTKLVFWSNYPTYYQVHIWGALEESGFLIGGKTLDFNHKILDEGSKKGYRWNTYRKRLKELEAQCKT